MPDKSAEKFARVVPAYPPGTWAWALETVDGVFIKGGEYKPDLEETAKLLNAAHEKAVQEALLDVMTVELFEKAPCYVCGYNSEGYYQPDIHPCAKKYHAIRALRGNG